LSILPNIKYTEKINEFDFSAFEKTNLKKIKTTFNIDINEKIITVLNKLFFTIYDICQKFNNDEFYYSNGKIDGFRAKIIQFITFFCLNTFEDDIDFPKQIFEKFNSLIDFDKNNLYSFINVSIFNFYHLLNNIHYWKNSIKWCQTECYYHDTKLSSFCNYNLNNNGVGFYTDDISNNSSDCADRYFSIFSNLKFNLFENFEKLSTELISIYREYYHLAFIYWDWFHEKRWNRLFHSYGDSFKKLYSTDKKELKDDEILKFIKFYYQYHLCWKAKTISDLTKPIGYANYRTSYIMHGGKVEKYIVPGTGRGAIFQNNEIIQKYELFKEFIKILQNLDVHYWELSYDQKISQIITEILKNEIFKKYHKLNFSLFSLTKEIKNVAKTLNSFSNNSNAYKLLNIFLKDEPIWDIPTLLDKLENFTDDKETYSETSKLINEFNSSINHIYKLANINLQLNHLFNTNQFSTNFKTTPAGLNDDNSYIWHQIAFNENLSDDGLELINKKNNVKISVDLLENTNYEFLTVLSSTFKNVLNITLFPEVNSDQSDIVSALISGDVDNSLKFSFTPKKSGKYFINCTSEDKINFEKISIFPAPELTANDIIDYQTFIKTIVKGFNEIRDYDSQLKILFKNEYKIYDGVSYSEMNNIFMSMLKNSLRDFYLHLKTEILVPTNIENGVNFYLKDKNKIFESYHINDLFLQFYNLIDNRIGNLETMKLKLDDHIKILENEKLLLQSKLNKLNLLSGNNEKSTPSSSLLLSANFFINENFNRQPITKIELSASAKKYEKIRYFRCLY
jgi:hypothetical protein